MTLGRAVRALSGLVLLAGACSVELAPLAKGSGATGGTDVTAGAGGSGATTFDAASGAGGSSGGVGGSGGVAGSAGAQGGSGGSGPDPCLDFCTRMLSAGCSADSLNVCTQDCAADLALVPKCDPSYVTYLQCGATTGAFTCNAQGYAVISNCVGEWNAYWDCTWAFTPTCPAPGVPPSGGGCYSGANCNPVLNSCSGGDVCGFDTADGAFHCYPGPNTQGVCGSCDYTNGPYCIPGSECLGNGFTQCARFCCTDADCGGAPHSCIAVGYYSGVLVCGQT